MSGLAAAVELPNEARTVENAVLDWLQSPELGWRYEDARTVAREYRARQSDGTVDEREALDTVRPTSSLSRVTDRGCVT